MPSIDPPDPEVYREAARLIGMKAMTFSCLAIREAEHRSRVTEFAVQTKRRAQYERQYTKMFGPKSPKQRRQHPFWNKCEDYFLSENPELERECRVLALLLMADICEQGVRP